LFFVGSFPLGETTSQFGLGFLDLRTSGLSFSVPSGSARFTTDASGRRVAYQGVTGQSVQYFLYAEGERTLQLTDDPEAIIIASNPEFCPQRSATIPLINGDGSRVVLMTSATLGMADADDSVGCRVFSYAAQSGDWRHVASLPRSKIAAFPALSDDGRLLSFLVSLRINRWGDEEVADSRWVSVPR
jgi:hypothetical protein